jgi:hypothetical protein
MIRTASALQEAGLHPILTFSSPFRMISTMKTMFQDGLNGRVPVPPEKRFLIHSMQLKTLQGKHSAQS